MAALDLNVRHKINILSHNVPKNLVTQKLLIIFAKANEIIKKFSCSWLQLFTNKQYNLFTIQLRYLQFTIYK